MRYPFFISILLMFCVLMFAACGGKQEEKVTMPEWILDDTTFTKVLAGFALAESAANINIKATDFRKQDSVYAFDPLKDNGVTQAQYDSTVHFYVRHPELYKKIYEEVLVELSEMQAKRSAETKPPAEPK